MCGRFAITNRFRTKRMLGMRIGMMRVIMIVRMIMRMIMIMVMMMMVTLVETARARAKMIAKLAIFNITPGGGNALTFDMMVVAFLG